MHGHCRQRQLPLLAFPAKNAKPNSTFSSLLLASAGFTNRRSFFNNVLTIVC
jgi:hypothetical protein